MTDHSELKRLAEAAPEGPWFGPEYAPGTSYVFDVDLGTLLHYESIESEQDACLRYVASANPAAVLALIAEVERLSIREDVLENLCDARFRINLDLETERDKLKAENEALTKIFSDAPDLPDTDAEWLEKTHALEAERDQLKAEAARSTEREIIQLAEIEALRKIISESATACGAAVSVGCSVEFMQILPAEIALVVGRLRGVAKHCATVEQERDKLKAENEALLSLLGQSALAATTLRTDAEALANHSGFNRVFVDFIRAKSGVEVGHGYGSSKYPKQGDVLAVMSKGDKP